MAAMALGSPVLHPAGSSAVADALAPVAASLLPVEDGEELHALIASARAAVAPTIQVLRIIPPAHRLDGNAAVAAMAVRMRYAAELRKCEWAVLTPPPSCSYDAVVTQVAPGQQP
jgi:hypothetical protein